LFNWLLNLPGKYYGVLRISLDAFSVEDAFFICSPNEDLKGSSSARIVFTVFLAIKLRAGVICALLNGETR